MAYFSTHLIDHLEIRNKLRELGYDAKLVNGNCYDITQTGRIHYLSEAEAKDLIACLNHPVDLFAHATRQGLIHVYKFTSVV